MQRQEVHPTYRRVLIEVPSIERASGDAGMQILQQGEFEHDKAYGGPPSMEGGTEEEEEEEVPPLYDWRVIVGVVCVLNYCVL